MRENAPHADVKFNKSVKAPPCLKDLPERFFVCLLLFVCLFVAVFVSQSFTINPATLVSEISSKGNDSELSNKTDGRRNGVSRLCMLIG